MCWERGWQKPRMQEFFGTEVFYKLEYFKYLISEI